MNKKIMLVLITIVLLSCNFLFPIDKAPAQAPDVAEPTQSSSQPNENSTSALPGFTVVRLHPEDGDLQAMLANEGTKSRRAGTNTRR